MTTKKQMERYAKMNRPPGKEPKLTVPGAIGILVCNALSALGVKTLGLPCYSMAYKMRVEVIAGRGQKCIITLEDRPVLPFKITVELAPSEGQEVPF